MYEQRAQSLQFALDAFFSPQIGVVCQETSLLERQVFRVRATNKLVDLDLIRRNLMFNQRRVLLLAGAKGPYRCVYCTAERFKATATVQPNPWTRREEGEGGGLWMEDEELRQSSTGAAAEGKKTTHRAEVLH